MRMRTGANCAHTYSHFSTHVHARTNTFTCAHTRAYTHKHIHIHARARTCTHKHIQKNSHASARAHVQADSNILGIVLADKLLFWNASPDLYAAILWMLLLLLFRALGSQHIRDSSLRLFVSWWPLFGRGDLGCFFFHEAEGPIVHHGSRHHTSIRCECAVIFVSLSLRRDRFWMLLFEPRETADTAPHHSTASVRTDQHVLQSFTTEWEAAVRSNQRVLYSVGKTLWEDLKRVPFLKMDSYEVWKFSHICVWEHAKENMILIHISVLTHVYVWEHVSHIYISSHTCMRTRFSYMYKFSYMYAYEILFLIHI